MTHDVRRQVDLLLICPMREITSSVPLGVMSIASYIRTKGHSVEILADTVSRLKKKLVKFNLRRTVVGFSATTDVVELAMELCAWLKEELSPDVYCVIGGIHATAMPQETLMASEFDCLVQGEGELTLLELLERFLAGADRPYRVPGTWEKDGNGGIVAAPPRALIQDLDTLPKPAFDLVDFNRWRGFIRTTDVHCKRVAYLLTSRGCPFDCVFCDSKSLWQRKLRAHSVRYCADVMEELVEKYQLDGFSFLDDELVVHKKRILELCSEIEKRGLHKRIKWEAHSTASASDEEVFRIMREAGCVNVRIGLESGSEKVLRFLKRGQSNVEKNYRAVRMARAAGLHVFGSFIIGSPEETVDDILDTIHFIRNSGITDCAVFVAVPYPGTDLYAICKEKGYLRPNLSYNDYRVEGPDVSAIIRNEAFTSEQLDAIKRFIGIHITEPLNDNKKVRDLDYRYELERIMRGDLTMTDYSTSQKLMKRTQQFSRRVVAAVREPRKVLIYFSRRIGQ
jgi:anaerobic magnesium-protoporphyrin IX monomethyl ester cyclase